MCNTVLSGVVQWLVGCERAGSDGTGTQQLGVLVAPDAVTTGRVRVRKSLGELGQVTVGEGEAERVMC